MLALLEGKKKLPVLNNHRRTILRY